MQLEIPWRDEAALTRELEARTGLELQVTITDNASTVMSFNKRRQGQLVRLRLHHMFLAASPQVIRALADWVVGAGKRRAGQVLDTFIARNDHLLRLRPAKGPVLQTKGTRFDLQALLDVVNAEHFGGGVTASITWGRKPRSRRRRSIQFGSYSQENNLIRVHPLLDQGFVPEYFVRYIVFHEMLHAFLGIAEGRSGRQSIHLPEFTRRERAYPDFLRATAWIKNPSNLRKLLRSNPIGPPHTAQHR